MARERAAPRRAPPLCSLCGGTGNDPHRATPEQLRGDCPRCRGRGYIAPPEHTASDFAPPRQGEG